MTRKLSPTQTWQHAMSAATGDDKSELAHPEPRRIRDKEHLRFVRTQPYLICGRTPADPHHLRFAQHRALGRKVSDEWVVALCRGHHREVHRHGDERDWWQKTGIRPERCRPKSMATVSSVAFGVAKVLKFALRRPRTDTAKQGHRVDSDHQTANLVGSGPLFGRATPSVACCFSASARNCAATHPLPAAYAAVSEHFAPGASPASTATSSNNGAPFSDGGLARRRDRWKDPS